MRAFEVIVLGVSWLLACVASLPAAPAALFEEIHVVQWPKQKWGYRGAMGDIELLKDGRLLLAYTIDDAGILGRYSDDGGKTWGAEFMMIPDPKPAKRGEYYCHPSLLRLASGDLLFSYIYLVEATPRFVHNYYRRSTDDGKTWGDQLIVTPVPGCNAMHNDKLLQLSSGRIVAPAEREAVPDPGQHAGYVSFACYSDDNGYSWQRSNEVNALPIEAQEPHVVELKNGRLMMLCRTYSGFVLRAYSHDRGATWSKGEPVRELKLSANSSALNVKRIPKTGDLVLLRSTGGKGGYRTPFVAAVSADEGKTWGHERAIAGDPDDDYGYPSLTFLDGLAIISFHKRDGIYVARIGTDWFYGK